MQFETNTFHERLKVEEVNDYLSIVLLDIVCKIAGCYACWTI